VGQIIRIGMNTSKHIFQLHGVDASERVVLRKRLGRNAMLAFFAKLPPTVVVIEACGAAHYLARELCKLGHTAKLIAPQLVKPYVPRNKNDGRDAEGLCEAASRPRRPSPKWHLVRCDDHRACQHEGWCSARIM